MNHLNQTYNSIKYRYNGLPNKIQIIIIALSVSLIYILPLLTISNGVLMAMTCIFILIECWVYLAYGKVRLILGLFTKLGRE